MLITVQHVLSITFSHSGVTFNKQTREKKIIPGAQQYQYRNFSELLHCTRSLTHWRSFVGILLYNWQKKSFNEQDGFGGRIFLEEKEKKREAKQHCGKSLIGLGKNHRWRVLEGMSIGHSRKEDDKAPLHQLSVSSEWLVKKKGGDTQNILNIMMRCFSSLKTPLFYF